MPISSIVFLFIFFPVVLTVYFLLSFAKPLQNFWLFAAGIAFYMFGQTFLVIPLLIIILTSWLSGLLISRAKGKVSMALLVLACCLILGNLIFFKYAAPAQGTINRYTVFAQDVAFPDVPLGISFYTLHALAYCIDVYNGAKPGRNPVYAGLYISFFPIMYGGPVIRYSRFAKEIQNRKHSLKAFSEGICRFAAGFIKLNLIASHLANIANHVFSWSAMGRFAVNVPVTAAWLGLVACTMQIYLQLSAYADMAIGMGQIFGFSLPENFNQPYSAVSVTEFWRRWHITLTAWFREYVYIPLGRINYSNKDSTVRNLLIVWILIGVWHGPGLTNIFMGVWFFLLMLAEHFFQIKNKNIKAVFRRAYTLLAVMTGLALLRTENLYQAGRFFMNMLGLNNNTFHSGLASVLFWENLVWLSLGLLISTPLAHMLFRRLREHKSKTVAYILELLSPVVLFCALFLSVVYMTQ